jgi:hypothetical protein
MQDAAVVDDRHRSQSQMGDVTQSVAGEDLVGDSIELGMPHEPLSITFFKTAFSLSGLVGHSLPCSIPEEQLPRRPPLSSLLLEGLDEETSADMKLAEQQEGHHLLEDGATPLPPPFPSSIWSVRGCCAAWLAATRRDMSYCVLRSSGSYGLVICDGLRSGSTCLRSEMIYEREGVCWTALRLAVLIRVTIESEHFLGDMLRKRNRNRIAWPIHGKLLADFDAVNAMQRLRIRRWRGWRTTTRLQTCRMTTRRLTASAVLQTPCGTSPTAFI